MRVTHQTIVSQTILDMQRNLSRVEATREDVASGRRLSRPSDDPVDVFRALGFRNKASGIAQHMRNIDLVLARLNQTESVLASTNDALIQLKQLSLQLATGPTIDTLDRVNAIEQVQQFKEQITQFANTRSGNQFIFAGSNTRTRPYEASGDQVLYKGNTAEISIEVEDNNTVPINIPGIRVFDTSANGIFQMLDDFKAALEQDNTVALREIMESIDTQTEVALNARSTNAARTQRLEISRDRLFDDSIDTTEALSQTEDVDLAQAITEFADQQNAYQASLSSTARAIQPSLLSVLG